jgi:hypothetical protein
MHIPTRRCINRSEARLSCIAARRTPARQVSAGIPVPHRAPSANAGCSLRLQAHSLTDLRTETPPVDTM